MKKNRGCALLRKLKLYWKTIEKRVRRKDKEEILKYKVEYYDEWGTPSGEDISDEEYVKRYIYGQLRGGMTSREVSGER